MIATEWSSQVEQTNTATVPTTFGPRVETHWTRTLYVDFYDGPRPRAFRRIGIALATVCVVVAVTIVAFLEATVLASVAAPEAAAAAVVCRVLPPAKPDHA